MVKKVEWNNFPIPKNQTEINRYFELCNDFFIKNCEKNSKIQIITSTELSQNESKKNCFNLMKKDICIFSKFECFLCKTMIEKEHACIVNVNPYSISSYCVFCDNCFK